MALIKLSCLYQISSRLSGVRLPQHNATIYSVTGDSLSRNSLSSPSGPNRVDAIITVLAPEGNAGLRDTLLHRLQQIAPEVSQDVEQQIKPMHISRFGEEKRPYN